MGRHPRRPNLVFRFRPEFSMFSRVLNVPKVSFGRTPIPYEPLVIPVVYFKMGKYDLPTGMAWY